MLSYNLPLKGAHHAGGGDGGISVGEGSTLDGGASIDSYHEMVGLKPVRCHMYHGRLRHWFRPGVLEGYAINVGPTSETQTAVIYQVLYYSLAITQFVSLFHSITLM